MNSLREIQKRFYECVTGSVLPVTLGTSGAMPTERGSNGLRAPAVADVTSSATLSAFERLSIYADAYGYRLVESVREDFPMTARLLGEPFSRVVRTYLKEHPPKAPSLRYLGSAFPAFLDRAAVAIAPYAGDLARLEWARGDVFDCANDVPLAVSDLAATPQEQWPGLRLSLGAAVRRVRLTYPIDNLWADLQAADTAQAREMASESMVVTDESFELLVWRRRYAIFHRRVEANESRALDLFCKSTTFGEFCNALGDLGDSAESVAASTFQFLKQWTVDEMLTRTEWEGP